MEHIKMKKHVLKKAGGFLLLTAFGVKPQGFNIFIFLYLWSLILCLFVFVVNKLL